MIRSILRRIEVLEKKYPRPSAGERANKRVAAYLRTNPILQPLVKDLPPTEMDNQQIADFIRSYGFGFHMGGLVPEEYMTEEELCESRL
jgi:hypothetical protein